MAAYIVTGVFILFDILTGLLKALYKGNINSTILREGLFHKITEFIAVFGAGLLEYGANYIDFGKDLPTLGVVTIYICFMELVSILENLCEVNPSLNTLFAPYLDKLKSDKE